MDRNVVEFMQSAKEHGLTPEQLAHISVAMSMKRIADAMHGQPVTLLAQISESLGDIARAKKLGL